MPVSTDSAQQQLGCCCPRPHWHYLYGWWRSDALHICYWPLTCKTTRIGEKFLEWSDKQPELDQILDSVSLYWFTSTFPRSVYPYRQFFGPNPEAIPLKHPVEKPVGYSWFPKEIAPIPRAWVATTCNLVWYKHHNEGGHFAAMEMPKELLADIEDFVKQVWC
jgi:microsomal epoxide hydrolase